MSIGVLGCGGLGLCWNWRWQAGVRGDEWRGAAALGTAHDPVAQQACQHAPRQVVVVVVVWALGCWCGLRVAQAKGSLKSQGAC